MCWLLLRRLHKVSKEQLARTDATELHHVSSADIRVSGFGVVLAYLFGHQGLQSSELLQTLLPRGGSSKSAASLPILTQHY